MARITVDYGIDLGTTNSSIAVFKDGDAFTIDNIHGQKNTPSVVWIRKGKGDASLAEYIVGQKAKERINHENVISAFKKQMGKNYQYEFSNIDFRIKPEELSAELLKELRKDVQSRMGEEITSAVITVPAIFDTAACDATKKAAELAGFEASSLVMEPVAASIAYGFQKEVNKKTWLVYDLGGGTFDAALIHVRDGIIQIINHGGDLHLGGKDIDYSIAEKILIPAIKKEYDIEFHEGGLGYLLNQAENAKIQLSQNEQAVITIEDINSLRDVNENAIDFEYTLKKEEIEPFVEHIANKTINICKKVIAEKNFQFSDIENVILVGGPTLTPILRNMLSKELGIPLEYKIDPLAVVSRGAAIFAGAQILKTTIRKQHLRSQYSIELDYEPIGSDPEPLVSGKVENEEIDDFSNYTIEFVNKKTEWRSGKVKLSENGSFITTLKAEKGKQCEYLIELRDESGVICNTEPENIYYTLGLSIAETPLMNSIGVGTYDGKMDLILEKGRPLPSRAYKKHITMKELKQGQPGYILNIPILEGENILRAERNLEIGSLLIPSESLKRDLPSGSEVEITIEIDESRLIRTHAYIPVLDQEFEGVHKLLKDSPDIHILINEVDSEKERLEDLFGKIIDSNDPDLHMAIKKIKSENLTAEIEENLKRAQHNEDAADKVLSQLLQIKSRLDEIEDKLSWPNLVNELKYWKTLMDEIVNEDGDENVAADYKTIIKEAKKAYDVQNAYLLQIVIEKIKNVYFFLRSQQPDFWIGYFQYITDMKNKMTNYEAANKLIAQGNKAVSDGDLESLKASVRQMVRLLPEEQQEEAKKYKGSTMPI